MKKAFINGIILTGHRNMEPIKDHAVIVNKKEIEGIIPLSEVSKGKCKIIDLNGKYIMPGLINLHAHLASSGKPPKANEKPKDYKKMFDTLADKKIVIKAFMSMEKGLAKQELFSGVTTLRAVGGILNLDGRVRDAIARGKSAGPRILAANTAISVPGGHFAGSLATEASTPEEAVQHVRMIAKTRPDLIKLMITGGVMDATIEGEPGVLRMSPEIVKAACDEAHRLGYFVAAHVESPEGVRVALENGVDTIEHGALPDDQIIELFKERGAADICTISPALPYAVLDTSVSHCEEIAKKNGKVVMDGIIACAKACLENDIPVGLGTDAGCPFISHYDMWREVFYFAKYCHVTPKFALYTATLRNATIARIDHITGSIEEGKYADMIVTKDNPLEDLKALRHIDMVVMEGKVYKHPKVKRKKKIDKVLDPYL